MDTSVQNQSTNNGLSNPIALFYELQQKNLEMLSQCVAESQNTPTEAQSTPIVICYTVADIQRILRVSRPSVYQLLSRNVFPWVQINKQYRIPKEGFDEWLNRQKGET